MQCVLLIQASGPRLCALSARAQVRQVPLKVSPVNKLRAARGNNKCVNHYIFASRARALYGCYAGPCNAVNCVTHMHTRGGGGGGCGRLSYVERINLLSEIFKSAEKDAAQAQDFAVCSAQICAAVPRDGISWVYSVVVVLWTYENAKTVPYVTLFCNQILRLFAWNNCLGGKEWRLNDFLTKRTCSDKRRTENTIIISVTFALDKLYNVALSLLKRSAILPLQSCGWEKNYQNIIDLMLMMKKLKTTEDVNAPITRYIWRKTDAA